MLGSLQKGCLQFFGRTGMDKLQGWKTKFLSHAGRKILLKAVVQAIPTYAMACFLFPNNLCESMNSMMSNFWWKGDSKSKGIHWVAWDKLSLPKTKGGLGFRDFRAFNKALLVRQGWRLLKYPNSFVAQFLKGIYFPNSDFLNALKGARASWAWASLLEGRKILQRGIRWQISNGALVNFWEDKWIPTDKDFRIKSCKPAGCPILKVIDAINPITKSWNEGLLTNLVSRPEVRNICAIPISIDNTDDTLIWHHDCKGLYKVKSGYQEEIMFQQAQLLDRPSTSFHVPESVWKMIWGLPVPPKLKHFWWRCCHNSLATKQNIYRRRCTRDGVCPVCLGAPESIEHLLYGCAWTKAVWFGSDLGLILQDGISSISKWMCDCTLPSPITRIGCLFLVRFCG